VVLDGEGNLTSAALIAPDGDAAGTKWYAYVVTAENRPWMNGQAYLDTLSPEAVGEFIRVTYLAYQDAVGEELVCPQCQMFFVKRIKVGIIIEQLNQSISVVHVWIPPSLSTFRNNLRQFLR
jgi:hypothetical protein